MGRECERIDCHVDPLRPRATRHDNETLPVRVYVEIRMIGTGVPGRQNRRAIHDSRAAHQVDPRGNESVIAPIEQLAAIPPPSWVPSPA